MDEGQNAIIDLSPVNSPLKNLFLVFILKLHFIPLKQIPSQKDENKTKNPNKQKTQNNENQPTNQQNSPKPKQKNPHQTQSKNKTKLRRQLLFSQRHLVISGLSSITLCTTSLSLQGFSCFNCRQSFALTYIPAHISLITDTKRENIVYIYCLHCKRPNLKFQSWQLKNIRPEVSATGYSLKPQKVRVLPTLIC